ncbi:MAG: hypothetical protein BWY82_02662 [Verrucomicrobia bacterium ADurb.Bin474]|nr:MAG: hypothetical protein BWY82_02662 [Verrucomicrobia bacterium ADurb.Bin474]
MIPKIHGHPQQRFSFFEFNGQHIGEHPFHNCTFHLTKGFKLMANCFDIDIHESDPRLQAMLTRQPCIGKHAVCGEVNLPHRLGSLRNQ